MRKKINKQEMACTTGGKAIYTSPCIKVVSFKIEEGFAFSKDRNDGTLFTQPEAAEADDQYHLYNSPWF